MNRLKLTTISTERKAVSAIIAVVLTLAIVFGALGAAWAMGVFKPASPPQTCTINCNPSSSSSSSSSAHNAGSFTSGTLTLSVAGDDHFDTSVSYTPGTNFAVTWLDKPSGQWHQITVSSSNQITVPSSDNGVIYAEVSIPVGQNYYVDAATIQKLNTGITSVQYTTIGAATVPQYIFGFNLAQAVSPSGLSNTAPTLSFAVYLIKYVLPTINTPSNLVNLGSSATQPQFIAWTLTFGTSNSGLKISQIEIITNDSVSSVASLQSMNDPAVGTSGTQLITQNVQGGVNTPQGTAARFVSQTGGNVGTSTAGSTDYYYYIAASQTDLSTAETLFQSSGNNNVQSYQTAMTFNFGATTGANGVSVEILITYIQPSGQVGTITSTVTAASGALP